MNKSHIEDVRSFNRFYTGVIGLLDKNILNSDYNLPEVRIMYELYTSPGSTAKELINIMNIDKGYFSRIVRDFNRKGLIKKQVSKNDGRFTMLSLTKKGESVFTKLNETQNEQVRQMLENIPSAKRVELISHMKSIKEILSELEFNEDE